MKGSICVTLNDKELVFIPVQNIEYIGCSNEYKQVLICLSVGSRRAFSIRESMDEVKALLLEATR